MPRPVDLVAHAVGPHDAHRTLERQRILHGFGVDRGVSRELARLVVVRKIRHAIQVRSILLAVFRLVEHAPAAVCDGVQRLGVDSVPRRLDFELVVKYDRGRPVSLVVSCPGIHVKLHHHHAGSVERDAHIADSLVERPIAARGLCCPVDRAIVLSAVVSVEGDVPYSDQVFVVENKGSGGQGLV